jgi:hypothetical protein
MRFEDASGVRRNRVTMRSFRRRRDRGLLNRNAGLPRRMRLAHGKTTQFQCYASPSFSAEQATPTYLQFPNPTRPVVAPFQWAFLVGAQLRMWTLGALCLAYRR